MGFGVFRSGPKLYRGSHWPKIPGLHSPIFATTFGAKQPVILGD